jgi:uncharacterized Ntn-hydrolase superfamily protein
MLGVAITTSSICVGSRCPWARAKVGAVATQNITDPSLGEALLELLARDFNAQQALANVLESGANMEYRQIALIDSHGLTAHHSGSKTLGTHNVSTGANCIGAGNILANPHVPAAMTARFAELADEHLAGRLLASLRAGLAAGGERGPVKSAALLVVDEHPWPLVDLRVDWDDAPIENLHDLWRRYEPQMQDYVTRAINPAAAPSYGVPGDP